MSHLFKVNALRKSLLEKGYSLEDSNNIIERAYIRALTSYKFNIRVDIKTDDKIRNILNNWNEILPFDISNVINGYTNLYGKINEAIKTGCYFNEYYDYKTLNDGIEEYYSGLEDPFFVDLLDALFKDISHSRG